jgi:hypothetical protein
VSDRWERILEQKPVSLQEHLLDEAAKLLLVELRQWPLPSRKSTRTPERESRSSSRRCPASIPRGPRSGAQAQRWDLEREHEAYDDFIAEPALPGGGDHRS